MAEAIKKQFNAEAKLIEGGGGVFDVRAGSTVIWSKHETGRFPEHEEVLDKLAELVGQT